MSLFTAGSGPPRGRWRIGYQPGTGFVFEVQPLRLFLGSLPEWPNPNEAWLELMRWERSYQFRFMTPRFTCEYLIRRMQREAPSGAPSDAFRIVLTHSINRLMPPDTTISGSFNAFVSQSRLRDPRALQAAVRGSRRASRPCSSRDRLSSLPMELFDMVLGYACEVNIEMRAFHSRGSELLLSSSTSALWTYAPSERAALLRSRIPRNYWVMLVSMPTFHVSRLFLDRTISIMARRIGAVPTGVGKGPMTAYEYWGEHLPCQATVRLDHDCANRDACDGEPLRWGLSYPTSEALRELPHHLVPLVRELCIETMWDCRRGELVVPVKRLMGFESSFPMLNRIIVSCKVVGIDRQGIEESRWWEDLAALLYGADGVYSKIVAEVGLVLTIGVWCTLTLRSGIWPGYCLRPECTKNDKAPCRARLPTLGYRVPVVDVRLMPQLEDWL